MAIRQIATPNLNVPATAGWCLKYVDDAVKAPNRQPTAQAAWNVENKNGNTRTGEPPIGVWVPIFFSLAKGDFAGLGHVAWAYNHGNGWIEIHDSETATKRRAVYTNIAQVTAWFGAFGCTYLGWSYWVDGVRAVEDYTPATTQPATGRIEKRGTATVTANYVPICNEPTNASPEIARYGKGQSFNYDSYQINDGFVWLSYISYSGVRRYVAEGPADGNPSNVWLVGGVSK